jgi:eukaryotic-like serine/threonine-protein kinase
VADRPGVVSAPWPVRRKDPTGEILAVWAQREASEAGGAESGPEGGDLPFVTELPAEPISRVSRVLAGVAAAVVAMWFATSVLSPSPGVPGLVALGAGLLVAIAPRAGWLVLVAGALLALALEHRAGGALVLAFGALPPLALLFRHSERWPFPALAPALAIFGLGGLWPALAGRGASSWQRAALGFTGWTSLVAGALLTGRVGYVRVPSGVPGNKMWMGSLYDTVHHVLPRLLSVGLLAPAIVWAAAALALPSVIGGQGLTRRIVVLCVWAAAAPVFTAAVLGILGTGASLATAQAALGALAALALALVVGALQDARRSIGSSDSRAGLA